MNLSQASQKEESAVSELRKRLDMSVSISVPELQIIDELEDKEFLELALSLIGVGEKVSSNGQISHTQVVWCFYVFSGWYFQLTMFSLVKKRQLRPFVTTG